MSLLVIVVVTGTQTLRAAANKEESRGIDL